MEIEIINWDKYNPKRDQKTYTWLRLNNDLLSGQEFDDYTPKEILTWISILSEASKKNRASIELKITFLCRTARASKKEVESGIAKLIRDNMVRLLTTKDDRARSQDVSATTPTNGRTDETNETDETNGRAITESEIIALFNEVVAGKGNVRPFPAYNLPRNSFEQFQDTIGFREFRTVEKWRELFEREVITSKFLMGTQDNSDFVITLQWIVEHENALKVLCGKYASGKGKKKNSIDAIPNPFLGRSA